MAVPYSTTWLDIYREANPDPASNPVGLVLSNFTFPNYFEGPSGSNTYNYSSWGQGYTATGYDCMWAVRNENNAGPVKFSAFQTQSYFYDQSTYQSNWLITNNLPGFPEYDLNYNLTFYDSTLTYQYGLSAASLINAQTQQNLGDISQTTTPLIYGISWKLTIDTDPRYPDFFIGDGFVDLSIAGTSVMTNERIYPGTNIFDYTTFSQGFMVDVFGIITSDVDLLFHL
jgi:hypothetical protein